MSEMNPEAAAADAGTEDALDAIAPDVPRGRLEGRAVGLDLTRSRELLGFEARVLLDDVAPQELADVAPAGSGA